MANFTVVDTTEEDAADLQFPKDWLTERMTSETPMCYTCASILKEPYIQCAECLHIYICVTCFASGRELPPHENNHCYAVIKNDFQVFDNSTWSAAEEVNFLDAILDSGYGNWREVARRMQTRSKQECEHHFHMTYLRNPDLPGFDLSDRLVLAPLPYWEYHHTDMDEPPRYSPNSGYFYSALGGYNAARSDFEVEYDNHAELVLHDVDLNIFQPGDKDYELGQALQVAISSGYTERLKERQRRKQIVREHGLILTRKILTLFQRYDFTVSRNVTEHLSLFMQLMSALDFDYLMESLHHVGELKLCFNRLHELRQNGLTRFHSCRLYQKLKRLRMRQKKELKALKCSPAYSWKTLVETASINQNSEIEITRNTRRPSQPLEILGLPGYNLLSIEERHLCSTVRLVPESYLEFKKILAAECKKTNGLKLAQARTLIKIDVNKTRKIYDFLLQQGYICQPALTNKPKSEETSFYSDIAK